MRPRTLVLRLFVAFVALVTLGGCFRSAALFPDQRIWDATWEGRFQTDDVEYVVLPEAKEAKTYIIGVRKAGQPLEVYRAALYPGWDDVLLLGVQQQPNGSEPVYYPIRRLSPTRSEMAYIACDKPTKAKMEAKGKDLCIFPTLDALRREMRTEYAASRTKASAKDIFKAIDRLTDKPLGGIGAIVDYATFEDVDGVHGALRIATIPVNSPLARSGLQVGEIVTAVDGAGSSTATALEARIAFAKPGDQMRLTIWNAQPKSIREVDIVVAARFAPKP